MRRRLGYICSGLIIAAIVSHWYSIVNWQFWVIGIPSVILATNVVDWIEKPLTKKG